MAWTVPGSTSPCGAPSRAPTPHGMKLSRATPVRVREETAASATAGPALGAGETLRRRVPLLCGMETLTAFHPRPRRGNGLKWRLYAMSRQQTVTQSAWYVLENREGILPNG